MSEPISDSIERFRKAITRPGEMLRCEPFAAVVPARTCVARRSQHGPAERHYAFVTCRQCAVGELVERQLAEHA